MINCLQVKDQESWWHNSESKGLTMEGCLCMLWGVACDGMYPNESKSLKTRSTNTLGHEKMDVSAQRE